jgi:pilus assembly protein Flp/PilA
MNQAIKSIKSSFYAFMKDEEGAQVVEYALIIAVVSIGLVVLLSLLLGGDNNPFTTFVTRVTTCLTTAVCA